jgi:HK97 family phage prohead protease
MKKKEQLFFKNIKLRASEADNKKTIEGIIPYDSKSLPIWGVTEIIDRGAFNKTLSDKSNIFALYAHDDNKVLGSTNAGTLELENTDDGLICRCELPNTTYGNDAWEIIKRGDVKTLSFGFSPVKWDSADNGKLRTLKEVKLFEVSFCVPFPAYPETNSQVLRGFKRMKIDIENVNEILEKEKIDEKELETLKELVKSINEVIEKNSPESEEEAAREEPPKNDTPKDTDTSDEPKEDKEKEAIKQEIISLIDTLFEIEKETSDEDKTEKEIKDE